MIIRLLTFLRIVRGVMLEDFQGQTYLSWIEQGVLHPKVCKVYPFMRVGNCILNDDGTVSSKSGSSYIKHWRYL